MAWSPKISFSTKGGRKKRSIDALPDNKGTTSALPSPPEHSYTDGSDENGDEDVAEKDKRADDAEKTIEQVYQTVWDAFCGLSTESFPTFQLRGQRSYEELCHRFQKHRGLLEYFEDQIRVDWDASTGLLTLRLISSVVHEIVQDHLVIAIHDELDRIAKEIPTLQAIRKNIITSGHTKLQKRKKGARAPQFSKAPDGQFRYKGEPYPPFIIEVAYSQEERNLLSKVKEIFREFPGGVCTVLTIDINYERPDVRKADDHPQGASVSLWASTQEDDDTIGIEKVIDSRIFRGADGQTIPGDLVLPFAMLLPLHKRSEITESARDAELRISFASLSKSVQIAKEEGRILEASPSPSPSPRPQKLRFRDKDGNVTGEMDVGPRPKRQQNEVFIRDEGV
ncbi:hypothetical protein F4825DRAFT_428700 [Nemania diffusa]|nr:hypothetical protein F4825DRAFT_428700 [Nemania diffusa]